MTTGDLLIACAVVGIRLEVRGDQLHVEALTNSVTPALRDALRQHKADLLRLLAPVTEFVSLRGGLAPPLPAVLLALNLERPRFALSLDGDHQIVIARTASTAELTAITEDDRLAIARWRWRLGALVSYAADTEDRPQ